MDPVAMAADAVLEAQRAKTEAQYNHYISKSFATLGAMIDATAAHKEALAALEVARKSHYATHA